MSGEKRFQAISVYARQRALNQAEIEQKCPLLSISLNKNELAVKADLSEKRFNFDHVFEEAAQQVDVYGVVVAPLLGDVISGYNCAVFAYGLTGTGKTHTIFGENNEKGKVNIIDGAAMGLVPRVAHELFPVLSKLSLRTQYTVRISFIEVYNEEVRDLLNESTPLRIYDDPVNKGSVSIKDMSKMTVMNIKDVEELLNIGLLQRNTSRSHALFTFLVDIKETNSKGEEIVKSGKLVFIDLGGSENAKRTAADQRARDGGIMNRAIQTFSKVIKGVAMKMQHVPFRDSKLTRIVQDSFGGKTKTAMIVTYAPNGLRTDETLHDLDLISTAKSILNFPQVNSNKKQADLYEELQGEIKKLKEELHAARNAEGLFVSNDYYQKMSEEAASCKQKLADLVQKIKELEDHSRSIDQESQKLNTSFEQSKEYLVNCKEKLEAIQKKNLEEMSKHNVLLETHKDIYKKTNVLLDVSNMSSGKEAIYHKKYKERSAATLQNAKLSSEMISLAHGSFKKLENVAAENKALLLTQAESFTKYQENLVNGVNTEINKIDEFQKETERARTECRSNVEKIMNSTSEEVHNLGLQATSVAALKEDSSRRQQILIDSLGKFQGNVEDSRCNLQRSERVKNGMSKFASAIKSSLAERGQPLLQQQAKNEARFEAVTLERAEQQQRVDERLHVKEKIAERLGEAKRMLLQVAEYNKLTESNVNYMNKVDQVVSNQELLAQESVETAEENKTILTSQAASKMSELHREVKKILDTAQGCLPLRSNELQKLTSDVKNNLNLLRTTEKQRLAEVVAGAEKNVCQLEAHLYNQNLATVQFVNETVETTTDLSEKVNTSGHVGDTPVKINYVYPRVVKSSLPNDEEKKQS